MSKNTTKSPFKSGAATPVQTSSERGQEKIAAFIRELRQKKGMTQAEFAEKLGTSQSAVARIEAGEQNLSTDTLIKISEVLHHSIISVKKSTDFRVEGGRKLSERIETNTSKNGALGLLAASLLNKGRTVLRGIPKIEEVARMTEFLTSLGVSVVYKDEHTVEIKVPNELNWAGMNVESAKRMRSAMTCIGGLVHKSNDFTLPHAGGCKMGERTIEAFRHGLSVMGVDIVTRENDYKISHASKKGLSTAEVVMYEISDTATISILIAAALVPGVTKIRYASPNYQVQDVCFFLEKCGVQIEGIGTSWLTVHGVAEINIDIEHDNSEDPIESMLFITAALMTQSTLTVTRCPIEFLEVELMKLEYMGAKFKKSEVYVAKNGITKLVDITMQPSKLVAPQVKIHPLPYPGLNIDNLPFFVPLATQAEGTTLIHDWTWENRAVYFTELNRLGADIRLADPHRAFVTGKTMLKGAQIVSPPALRPAVIVLVAMLAAEGTSILRNVYSIERGYENIAERLNKIGAKIDTLTDL
jgi:UDP-N-acetylglucosamine 1-carboxyvinyltransferase